MAVRREKVLLEVESDLAPTMIRDAAAAKLLAKELRGLSGQAVSTSRATRDMSTDNDNLSRSATKAESTINQLTGRLRLLADVAAILGPALIPVGAVAIPAVAGLANELGVAALAGGTAILAFQGVGDALTAWNNAVLKPTAANLKTARIALEQLSPAARQMVATLQDLRPVLQGLRDTAAKGLFPGVTDALDALQDRLPDVERILHRVSSTLGDLLRDGGESLASARWDDFFHFLATDATQTLSSLGHVVGDLTHGMAELWMAFDPLNDDFSGWLEDVASGFDSWATGLSQTKGFTEFIDYVRTNGPQVADTFGALGNALLQIVEASAPLGGPVLKALESIARVVATIADSDLGTPIMGAVTAMALLSRATKVYEGLVATTWGAKARGNISGMVAGLTTVTSAQDRARMSAQQLAATQAQANGAVRAGIGTMGRGAAAIGLVATAMTDLDDKAGVANTAMLGFTGAMIKGVKGGAYGAAAGAILDIAKAFSVSSDEVENSIRVMDAAAGAGGGGLPAQIEATEAAIARMQAIMDDAQGLNIGIAKLWSNSDAADAADKVKILEAHLDDLRSQWKIQQIEAGKTGVQYGYVGQMLSGILPNVNDVEKAAKRGAGGALNMRSAMRQLGLQVGPTDERLAELQKQLEDNRKAARDVATQFFNLGDGLDDAKVSLREWIHSLEKQAAALRDFRINAEQAAKKGLDQGLIRALEEAGPAGALRMKQLANASESEIGRANRAWESGQREINRYVDATAHVPKALATNLSVTGLPGATADIGILRAALATLHDKTIMVRVNQIGGVTSSYGGQSRDDLARPGADGMTVPGKRYPYGDKIFTHLAPTEEVISNRYGQADRWRPLLKAINANKLADGGTVMVRAARQAPVHVTTSTGPLSATAALTDDQFARLEAAVERGAARGAAKAGTAASQALSEARWT